MLIDMELARAAERFAIVQRVAERVVAARMAELPDDRRAEVEAQPQGPGDWLTLGKLLDAPPMLVRRRWQRREDAEGEAGYPVIGDVRSSASPWTTLCA